MAAPAWHESLFLAPLSWLLSLLLLQCSAGQLEPGSSGQLGPGSDARPTAAERGHELNKHLGRWEGLDSSGRLGRLELFANGRCAFGSDGGYHFGGREAGSKGALLYSIDYSRNPIWLDLIAVDAEGREKKRIKWILQFIAPDQIRARTFFDDRRPQGFEQDDDKATIYLQKVSS